MSNVPSIKAIVKPTAEMLGILDTIPPLLSDSEAGSGDVDDSTSAAAHRAGGSVIYDQRHRLGSDRKMRAEKTTRSVCDPYYKRIIRVDEHATRAHGHVSVAQIPQHCAQWALTLKEAQHIAIHTQTPGVIREDEEWEGRSFCDSLQSDAERVRYVRECQWFLPDGLAHLPDVLAKRRQRLTAVDIRRTDTDDNLPRDLFIVRRITNPAHPCCGSFGLFAARDLGFPDGKFSCAPRLPFNAGLDYLDVVNWLLVPHATHLQTRPSTESLLHRYVGAYSAVMESNRSGTSSGLDTLAEVSQSCYCLDVCKVNDTTLVGTEDHRFSVTVTVDSQFLGNETRFINDYRGIAPQPNVTFHAFEDITPFPQIGVFLTRPIARGEEVLIDYGEHFFPEDMVSKISAQMEQVRQRELSLFRSLLSRGLMQPSAAAAIVQHRKMGRRYPDFILRIATRTLRQYRLWARNKRKAERERDMLFMWERVGHDQVRMARWQRNERKQRQRLKQEFGVEEASDSEEEEAMKAAQQGNRRSRSVLRSLSPNDRSDSEDTLSSTGSGGNGSGSSGGGSSGGERECSPDADLAHEGVGCATGATALVNGIGDAGDDANAGRAMEDIEKDAGQALAWLAQCERDRGWLLNRRRCRTTLSGPSVFAQQNKSG